MGRQDEEEYVRQARDADEAVRQRVLRELKEFVFRSLSQWLTTTKELVERSLDTAKVTAVTRGRAVSALHVEDAVTDCMISALDGLLLSGSLADDDCEQLLGIVTSVSGCKTAFARSGSAGSILSPVQRVRLCRLLRHLEKLARRRTHLVIAMLDGIRCTRPELAVSPSVQDALRSLAAREERPEARARAMLIAPAGTHAHEVVLALCDSIGQRCESGVWRASLDHLTSHGVVDGEVAAQIAWLVDYGHRLGVAVQQIVRQWGLVAAVQDHDTQLQYETTRLAVQSRSRLAETCQRLDKVYTVPVLADVARTCRSVWELRKLAVVEIDDDEVDQMLTILENLCRVCYGPDRAKQDLLRALDAHEVVVALIKNLARQEVGPAQEWTRSRSTGPWRSRTLRVGIRSRRRAPSAR